MFFIMPKKEKWKRLFVFSLFISVKVINKNSHKLKKKLAQWHTILSYQTQNIAESKKKLEKMKIMKT